MPRLRPSSPLSSFHWGATRWTRWFPRDSISKVRARPRTFDGITIFPLYHPAAALHNSALRATIEDDFAKLGALLKERESQGAPAEDDAQDESGGSQQLSMF